MNPVPFILLAISLPLLLGGCGEKESVAEVGPQLDGVNLDQLEKREGIQYLSGSDTPYTGKAFALYENGQKEAEANFKDGKLISEKYWNSEGEPVDLFGEALK